MTTIHLKNERTKTTTTRMSIIIGLSLISATVVLPNASATVTRYPPQPPPKLSSLENKTIIDTAIFLPGLQAWSHGWKYLMMGFGSNNNELGKPGFQWQYASVVLKAPSSAPVACNNDWQATVVVDMIAMKVVSAIYPTIASHPCQVVTGGGPPINNLNLNATNLLPNIQYVISSPLKQNQAGTPSGLLNFTM